MIIPQKVYDQYDYYTSGMIAELGITCTILYPAVNTVITQSVPAFKSKNTLLPTTDTNGLIIGDDTYKAVETSGTVKLRVYWDTQSWKKIGGINLPDGSVMAIGWLSDLPKLKKANELLIHTNVGENFTFSKIKEPQVYGLTKKNLLSFWGRNA